MARQATNLWDDDSFFSTCKHDKQRVGGGEERRGPILQFLELHQQLWGSSPAHSRPRHQQRETQHLVVGWMHEREPGRRQPSSVFTTRSTSVHLPGGARTCTSGVAPVARAPALQSGPADRATFVILRLLAGGLSQPASRAGDASEGA